MGASGESRVRVCIATLAWNASGGLEIVAGQVARSVSNLGFHVDVIAIEDEQSSEAFGFRSVALGPRSRIESIAYARFGISKRLRAHAAGIPSYELVIFTHIKAAGILRYVEPKSWPRYIIWAHGVELWGSQISKWKAILRKAWRIVAVSNFTASMLSEFAPKVVRIYNPVDTEYFTAGSVENVSRDEVMICSRLSDKDDYKGHDNLIRAIRVVEEKFGRLLRLSIVGGGSKIEDLDRFAALQGVASRTTFAGRLRIEDLRWAYRRCAVFCMPSRVERSNAGFWSGEGLGIVYLEAAACGRPVIASCDGGAPETIIHASTGWAVDPRDVDAIAGALNAATSDPQTADEMGAAGRRFVEQRFSLQEFQKNVTGLFMEMKA